MRVNTTVEVPDQKQGLDSALAKQFTDMQRQLMGLVKDQSESKEHMHEMMMDCMSDNRDMFLKAMDRLVGMVGKALESNQPSDELLGAMRGLKQTVSELPGDLKESLDKPYRASQERAVTVSVSPHVTLDTRGLMQRLDSLQDAVLEAGRRSRNRTFGSNY